MIERALFINGEWTAAADGRTDVIVNPATERPIARVAKAGAADADRAVAAARAAAREWGRATPGTRAAALLAMADRIAGDAGRLTDLESRNTGKPLDVAADDVEAAAENLRFFAGAARTLEGRAAGEYLEQHTSFVRREPLGVVAAIAPWNYPLLMAAWKIGPALACGNTVVLKPSEITPLTALALADLAAGLLPPGVLNVVTGDGDAVGAHLVAHPDVAAVSLTGDTATGRTVMRAAADTLKKLHLELGGKAAAIVFDDADLDEAAEGLCRSGLYNSGQDCTAVTRVLIHARVAKRLMVRLEAAMRRVRVGDPRKAGTVLGPLVSRVHRDQVAAMVDRARAAGATIAIGGRVPKGRGFFYPPTLITGVRQDAEIVQREVFGPVMTVQTFRTEDEALAMANGVSYALTASVWTRDAGRALRWSRDLEAGTVWVNDHMSLTPEMPHGGGKQSGHGRDMSVYALEEYSQFKHVMMKF